MNFKSEINMEDRGPISHWLGDSQVWMQTAVEKDKTSGRGGNDSDHNVLNVAHVCTGLAFELVLKVLAKSEGRPIRTKHESLQNYQALSRESQTKIAKIVKTLTSYEIKVFLGNLDDKMCHPDRKYWMMGRDGDNQGVAFDQNVKGLIIPDLAKVHAKIADMVGENTFEDWVAGTQAKTKRGELLATIESNEDGSLKKPEITEYGKNIGVTTTPPQREQLIILCPKCRACEWIKEKQLPESDDQVTCGECQATMRAEDAIEWNIKRMKRDQAKDDTN